jgi:hypothetical protein
VPLKTIWSTCDARGYVIPKGTPLLVDGMTFVVAEDTPTVEGHMYAEVEMTPVDGAHEVDDIRPRAALQIEDLHFVTGVNVGRTIQMPYGRWEIPADVPLGDGNSYRHGSPRPGGMRGRVPLSDRLAARTDTVESLRELFATDQISMLDFERRVADVLRRDL